MKRLFAVLGLAVSCTLAHAQAPTPVSTPYVGPTLFPTPSGPIPTATPRPTSKTITAATYRAMLQKAIDAVTRVEKRLPIDARPILKPLDAPFKVQRADGATQTVRGDEWNRILTGLSGQNAAKLSRQQTKALKGSLQSRLRALDDWTKRRGGSYYTEVNAQKVVDDAVASHRIRVGPEPMQKWLADINMSVGNAITNFFKWIASLLPTPRAPSTSASLPNLSWLWFVFWAIMASLLCLLLFLAARALAGGTFTPWSGFWGLGKRRKKSPEELRDEDAALFQLAPEELRDRADIFASQGNFREALRHRFISLLVLLDARGLWRYDVRRTNWEHISLLRRDDSKRPLVAPLSNLTRAFDRVRYGGAPCDEDGWNQFQSGVREVESLVGGKAVAR